MVPIQIVFPVAVAITVVSGLAATGIVMFGDARQDLGQRRVAERFAQIALLGATAIFALLSLT